jgi:hypothetical protein
MSAASDASAMKPQNLMNHLFTPPPDKVRVESVAALFVRASSPTQVSAQQFSLLQA